MKLTIINRLQPHSWKASFPEQKPNDFENKSFVLEWFKARFINLRLDSLKKRENLAEKIDDAANKLINITSEEFNSQLNNISKELQQSDVDEPLLIKTMSLVAHAIYKETGFRLYTTQIVTACVILDNSLAEMQTGEGKSLSILLAGATAALAGIQVHIITANDYLAERDADKSKAIFNRLGTTVGAIIAELPAEKRYDIYRSDIVFCTARELVFDYLRDSINQQNSHNHLTQIVESIAKPSPHGLRTLPGLCFAIIDEADSILIDEAASPFVISKQGQQSLSPEYYQRAISIASKLKVEQDFTTNRGKRQVFFTDKGRDQLESLTVNDSGLWQVAQFKTAFVGKALVALHLYHLNQDYLIKENEIVIIDDVTGRTSDGRKWSQGIHQFIELKESIDISNELEQMLQITYQDFFPRYLKLGGTSGTLTEDKNELIHTYGLPVTEIPSRVGSRRLFSRKLFTTQESKWFEVVKQIKERNIENKAVLVTVGSVKEVDILSEMLVQNNLEHFTLNAREDEQESLIISEVGEAGNITVATNIVGRGTDIQLSLKALNLGGLSIIQCHLNHSKRIDRQVAGRSARNGDPGEISNILSLEDQLIEQHLPGLLISSLQLLFSAQQALPSSISALIVNISHKKAKWQARRQRWRLKQQSKQLRRLLAVRGMNTS